VENGIDTKNVHQAELKFEKQDTVMVARPLQLGYRQKRWRPSGLAVTAMDLGLWSKAGSRPIVDGDRQPMKRNSATYSLGQIIPRRVFFANPQAAAPLLSPDGRWIAWLAPFQGVMNIWAAPRNDLAAARPLTRQSDRPIEDFWFARTNAHVLYSLDRDGEENFNIWRVGLDGSAPCNLTPCAGAMAVLIGMHLHQPNLIAVALNDRDSYWHDLHVIDILSGDLRLVYRNRDEIARFVVDGDLNLRLATTTFGRDGGLGVLRWDGENFHEIMAVSADDALVTSPLHFTGEGDAWFLLSSIGREKAALFRVDWNSGAQTLIAEHPQADIVDWIVAQKTGNVSAACAEYAKETWVAVDADVANDLSRLERELGAGIEVDSQSDDDTLWIVCAHRPDRPGAWYQFDRSNGRVDRLFAERPALDGAPLAQTRDIVISARDGLELVSYITLPPSEPDLPPPRPLPMVLRVHGGPFGRDSYGYNREVQWLANRGYAVLQVNFRGSSGFGKAFALASEGEWAGRMHDDLVDAVAWAVAAGIADPDRIAIYGSSYGGYAALVGAAFTPDLFCCSVSVAGIANLETMLENGPDYWSAYAEMEYRSVGDPRTEKGRALLEARSPINRVDQIVRPILIGHGAHDVRCRMSESDQIVAALQLRNMWSFPTKAMKSSARRTTSPSKLSWKRS
jgi:acylaminoacyl-peptidase